MLNSKTRFILVASSILIWNGCATSSSNEGSSSGIDREAIRNVVKSRNAQYQTCYEGAIDKRPGAIGKAIASFEILRDGRVANAKLKEVDPSLVDIRECLLREISALRFSRHEQTDTVEVNYPFNFDERQSFYRDRVAPSQTEIKKVDTSSDVKLPPDSTGATVPDRRGDLAPSKMSGLPSRKGDKSSVTSQPSKPPGPQPSPVVLPMPVPVSPSGN